MKKITINTMFGEMEVINPEDMTLEDLIGAGHLIELEKYQKEVQLKFRLTIDSSVNTIVNRKTEPQEIDGRYFDIAHMLTNAIKASKGETVIVNNLFKKVSDTLLYFTMVFQGDFGAIEEVILKTELTHDSEGNIFFIISTLDNDSVENQLIANTDCIIMGSEDIEDINNLIDLEDDEAEENLNDLGFSENDLIDFEQNFTRNGKEYKALIQFVCDGRYINPILYEKNSIGNWEEVCVLDPEYSDINGTYEFCDSNDEDISIKLISLT